MFASCSLSATISWFSGDFMQDYNTSLLLVLVLVLVLESWFSRTGTRTRTMRKSSVQKRRADEIEPAGLEFRGLHAQVDLDHRGLGFSKEPENVRKIVSLRVLDEVGLRDAGELPRLFDGVLNRSHLVHESQIQRLPARDHPPVGEAPPTPSQCLALP